MMNETPETAAAPDAGSTRAASDQEGEGPSTRPALPVETAADRPSFFERLAGLFRHRNGSSLREEIAGALAEAPVDGETFSPGERAMLNNMATSLLQHDRVETTVAKAKELRPVVEKLITLARRGDLHARRMVERRIRDRAVSGKLFKELGPRFASRPGGYTRIVKLGSRSGDGAELARIELLAE